jgi:hypothetical protein
LLKLLPRRGERYENPHSWQRTVDTYRALISQLHEAKPRDDSQVDTSQAPTGADGP